MISSVGGSSGYSSQALDAMWEKRFQKTDTNSDGKITKEELATAIPSDGKGPSADEVFSQVDTNQDGVIDKTEDKAAFEAMEKNRPQGGPPPPPDSSDLASSLLKTLDKDGDGKISEDELTQAISGDSQSSNISDIFKSVDSDEDGSITQTELEGFLKKMTEQMQQNPPPPPPDGTNASYDKTANAQGETSESSFSVLA